MRTVYGILASHLEGSDVFTTDTIFENREIAEERAVILVENGDYAWTQVIEYNFDEQ